MEAFKYAPVFGLSAEQTDYRLLTKDFVKRIKMDNRMLLQIEPEGLSCLAEKALLEVSHFYRPSHLEHIQNILKDRNSSQNDRYTALMLLQNAVISAQKVFPMCQDTGTAIIMARKGENIFTGADDRRYLSEGVYNAYTSHNLRYSQNIPIDMYQEVNSRTNLPAQIEIEALGFDEYGFLFMAKGGGSANKTQLFQETRATLTEEKLLPFLIEKMRNLGTAACPPYYIAFVIGGLSAEMTLKTVKLASARYLDGLPFAPSAKSLAFRDNAMEQALLTAAYNIGLGAQFGGKYFALETRVIRLPRHGASCPIGIGVSCNADRQIKAKINAEGIWLEQLENNPAKYLPQNLAVALGNVIEVDLNRSMDAIRNQLSQYPVGTALKLNGPVIVARDIAHAKLKERMDKGEELPAYFKNHIILYAGPAKTPEGFPCGSLGPTTSGRMDSYVPEFQAQDASLVMMGKGNRTKIVTDACQKYGGFYLSAIGGPAAKLGHDCINAIETLEYPELGMEAVFRIEVKDFPAFILTDDKGNDFFQII